MEIKETKKVFNIHTSHLRWRMLNRFMEFYRQRVLGGMPWQEVIATWNHFADRPEDTVWVTEETSKYVDLSAWKPKEPDYGIRVEPEVPEGPYLT